MDWGNDIIKIVELHMVQELIIMWKPDVYYAWSAWHLNAMIYFPKISICGVVSLCVCWTQKYKTTIKSIFLGHN